MFALLKALVPSPVLPEQQAPCLLPPGNLVPKSPAHQLLSRDRSLGGLFTCHNPLLVMVPNLRVIQFGLPIVARFGPFSCADDGVVQAAFEPSLPDSHQ